MKWEVIEPSRNNFTFDDADRYRDWAKANKKEIHCHNLVWHSQLPAWVGAGNFDNKTLISIMKNHIFKLAGRYKDVCTRWVCDHGVEPRMILKHQANWAL
jgi:endo-1,4-beta-xylanase